MLTTKRITIWLFFSCSLWILILAVSGFARAEESFFFEQEAPSERQSSCEKTMEKLRNNESIDDVAGDVIYNLKYINIHYLLEDYDEATRPGSKQKYVKKEDLENEIEKRKRDIYCRVELAMYLDKQPQEVIFGLEKFIAAALEKVDDTYQSASTSFQKKNFERASYAFDLIAPYKDAHKKLLVTATHLSQAKQAEKVAQATAEKSRAKSAAMQEKPLKRKATIPQALASKATESQPQGVQPDMPDRVAMAASDDEKIVNEKTAMIAIGPITKAALTMHTEKTAVLGPISRAARRL